MLFNRTRAPTSTSAVDWWPMFHHDLAHAGYSTSPAPNTNQTLWTYPVGNWVRPSPVVANGIVYVGSYDDNVYALNAATGVLIWKYQTGGWVSSSPAVANGVVYVGSWDGKVYAFGSPQTVYFNADGSITPAEAPIYSPCSAISSPLQHAPLRSY